MTSILSVDSDRFLTPTGEVWGISQSMASMNCINKLLRSLHVSIYSKPLTCVALAISDVSSYNILIEY